MGFIAKSFVVLFFAFNVSSQTAKPKPVSVTVTVDGRNEIFVVKQSEIPLCTELSTLFCRGKNIVDGQCTSKLVNSIQLINDAGRPTSLSSSFTLGEKLDSFVENKASYSDDKQYAILSQISSKCFSANMISLSFHDRQTFNNIFGDLLYRLGEYKGGISCFHEIVIASPKDKNALYHLGAMRESVRPGEGIEFLLQSAKYNFFRK